MKAAIPPIAIVLSANVATLRVDSSQAISSTHADKVAISITEKWEFAVASLDEPMPPKHRWITFTKTSRPIGPGITWLRFQADWRNTRRP